MVQILLESFNVKFIVLLSMITFSDGLIHSNKEDARADTRMKGSLHS